jgi:hypothetical protein
MSTTLTSPTLFPNNNFTSFFTLPEVSTARSILPYSALSTVSPSIQSFEVYFTTYSQQHPVINGWVWRRKRSRCCPLLLTVELSVLSEGKSINSWGIATFSIEEFHTSFIYHKNTIPSDHNLKPPGHDTG